jgi:hypothetical protein
MKYLLLIVFTVGFLSCQKENELDLNDDDKNSGLLAYFPLDSSYADASGNESFLEAFGSPEFAEGYMNEPSTAILLDGSEDFLVGSIGNLDTFSISMWVQSYRYYVGEWPQWRSAIFDYSNKQVYGSIDGISGATQIKCGLEYEEVEGIDIDNAGKWFHLYMAVGKDVIIYLNDSLIIRKPLQDKITYLSDIIYFGRASKDDEIDLTYFYGKLDEIRIYNRILDQEEIDELTLKQ